MLWKTQFELSLMNLFGSNLFLNLTYDYFLFHSYVYYLLTAKCTQSALRKSTWKIVSDPLTNNCDNEWITAISLLLSPFFTYLIISRSHDNLLLWLLVPFSAPTSTLSHTGIIIILQQYSQSYFPYWLKVLFKFTSYRALPYLEEIICFLESPLWPSVAISHSQGFHMTQWAGVAST